MSEGAAEGPPVPEVKIPEKSVVPKGEGLREKGKERAQQFFGASEVIIRKKIDRGELDKEKGELALTYDASKGVEENSKALRANVEALEDLYDDEEAKGTLDEISENIKVELDGKSYSLNEWKKELDKVTPGDKAILKEKGIYAFEFPEESATEIESPPETINDLFNSQEVSLREKIKEKEDKSEDTSLERMQLSKIFCAKKAEGERGEYHGQLALQGLKELGIDVDKFLSEIDQEKVNKGKELISEGLKDAPLNDVQKKAILDGNFDFENFFQNNDPEKYKGVVDAILGKELSEEDATEMIGIVMGDKEADDLEKKYGKNILFLIAGLFLLSIVVTQGVAKAGANN
ncbi:MAG: hypothetical protein V1697_00520 [Candidatus Levyibacteriota bacterium]